MGEKHGTAEPAEPSGTDVVKSLEEENRLIKERIRKLEEIRKKGINPYPYRFEKTHEASAIKKEFSHLTPESHTGKEVSVAGRITGMRKMGKASFLHILDNGTRLQVYLKEDIVGADSYSLLHLLDAGDFIGVSGEVFSTKTGEISVLAKKLELLSKSLRPLPEKYHGLKDTELKYRKRYLDLIFNPESRAIFEKRTAIIKAMREFLDAHGFMEVETPTLQPIYGGAAARPFTSFHNDLKMKLYLKISDELYLKRLIVGGFDRVYEIDKDFRNESIDRTHNPEFTMMECYAAYWDYNDMMRLTEEMYEFIAMKVNGTTKVTYAGNEIDVKAPWKRLTMVDAIREYAKIDVNSLSDAEMESLIGKYNLEIKGEICRGTIIQALFEEFCEEHLIQPVFIIDHPRESTPLCKDHRTVPGLVERFEPFINGWEVANAYSELNDPLKQRSLLEEQARQLKEGMEESNPMDEDFCQAVEHGMPPTGGLGIGIDRMVLLMTGAESIRDIIFFPTMKPGEK